MNRYYTAVAIMAAISLPMVLPERALSNAFDSFGSVQNRDLITMNVIPNARRWTNSNFTWEYAAAGAPAILAGLTNAQVRTPLDNWSTPINITIAAAPGAVGTQEIRILWANLGGGAQPPLASTGPNIGGGQINFSTIQLNNNAAVNWTVTGFQDVLQHEFGHSLGLVDVFNNNANTVADFIDQTIGGDTLAGAQKGNADNVMLGTGPANAAAVVPFDNDDIHGAAWLYGANNRNTIATSAWDLALGSDPGVDGIPGNGDDYNNYYRVADHHGADNAPPRNWFYKGTIGVPDPAQTLIEIPALGVTSHTFAMGGGNAGWTSNYNGERLQLLGPANFTGNFDVTLVSTFAKEELRIAKVNATVFSDIPTTNGPQNAPMIWVPVPEPASAGIMLIGLAAIWTRGRRRA